MVDSLFVCLSFWNWFTNNYWELHIRSSLKCIYFLKPKKKLMNWHLGIEMSVCGWFNLKTVHIVDSEMKDLLVGMRMRASSWEGCWRSHKM